MKAYLYVVAMGRQRELFVHVFALNISQLTEFLNTRFTIWIVQYWSNRRHYSSGKIKERYNLSYRH